MSGIARTIIVALTGASLASCFGDGPLFGNDPAEVRMVNAASDPVGLLHEGRVVSRDVPYQGSSSCVSVDPAQSGLSYLVRGRALAHMTPFFSGERATIFVTTIPNGPGFVFQPLTVTLRASTTAPEVTVVNATFSTRFDVHLVAPGAPPGVPAVRDIPAGAHSLPVTAGAWTVHVTEVGSATVLASLPERAFAAGEHVAIVVSPPDTAGGELRAFYWAMQSC